MANVYGSNGNRWWVGLNTGSSSTFSFADSGGPGNGYQAIPSGSAGDDAQFAAAAAYNKAHPSAPNTISVENILWYNINGPYASQSTAQQAISGVQSQNPAPGLSQQLGVPNPAAPFEDTAHALTAFYDKLTDGKMWRSLGWVLLGIILLILGTGLLIKNTAGKAVAGAVFPEVTGAVSQAGKAASKTAGTAAKTAGSAAKSAAKAAES